MDTEKIRRGFDSGMALVAAGLDYGLDCKVQGCKVNPANLPEASFPSIDLSIGYAYKGTPKHKHLLLGQSPSVISIDFSLNERILEVEDLEAGGGVSIRAYGFNDLIAEKFRSLLQQVSRNRYRRQDVFDLAMLLKQNVGEAKKATNLHSLREKSVSRNIEVNQESLTNPEVKQRAKAEYHTLADEIEGQLPDFDMDYKMVEAFYRSLPW